MKRTTKIVIAAIVVVALGVVGVMIMRARMHVSTSAGTSVPTGSYVALGDSVAAGMGLATASDPSACGRTNESYPHLVARSRNMILHDITCSGATLTNGILGEQDVNQLLTKPQITAAFAFSKPSLITLTAGANDIGWSSFIGSCYSGQCGTSGQTAAVSDKLALLDTSLRTAMDQIKQHYGATPPQVIVTGYYHIFPAAPPAACFDMTGITPAEQQWWRAQEDALNRTIQTVVNDYPFARYAAVDFDRHELCAAEPWIQDVLSPAPYHPTEEGATAISRAVIRTLDGSKHK